MNRIPNSRILSLALAPLAASLSLPSPPRLLTPTQALYVAPGGAVDLRHPMGTVPLICGSAKAEDGRAWFDQEGGRIVVCDEGASSPLPGPYTVLVGRFEIVGVGE